MIATLASVSPSFDTEIVDTGDLPSLLLLISFGVTFGLTRFITHSIRSDRFPWLGNIEAGDTHIHHLVWGICLLLVSGLLAVAVQPPLSVTAIVFGIGAALTLDEFALWLHLDDVYWSEQGRQSIDAVIVFGIVVGFMVLGVYPISFEDVNGSIGSLAGFVIALAFAWTLGRRLLHEGQADVGCRRHLRVPVAIYGACRLAKPTSSWAKKRYDEAKMARSRERYKGEEKIVKPDALTSPDDGRSDGASLARRCSSPSARSSSRRPVSTSPRSRRARARAC